MCVFASNYYLQCKIALDGVSHLSLALDPSQWNCPGSWFQAGSPALASVDF